MTDRQLVGAAILIGLAARWSPTVSIWIAVAIVATGGVMRRPWLIVIGCALIAGQRASADLHQLASTQPGPVHGVAVVRSDPQPGPFSVSFDASLRGARYSVEVTGAAMGSVRGLRVGEGIEVAGVIRRFDQRQSWQIARHLAGRVKVSSVGLVRSAPPPWRVANRLRSVILDGANGLDGDTAALFRGLVLGDDSDHGDALVHRFRASGLSHLLVVSGENVAFVLTAFAPLLRRLRLRTRWVVTAAILLMFGTIVRWEPSVLRAIAMAGLAVTASTMGRRASGLRIVAISVSALIVVDPLLVWSLGFLLSVSATLGLVLWSRPIAERLPGPRWLAEPLGVVLAAQCGVAPLLLALRGSIPASGLVSNLLAVPVAGWTMMWGATVGIVAGVMPTAVAAVLHLPTVWLISWIDAVARLGSIPGLPQLGGVELVWCAGGVVLATLPRRRIGRRVRQVLRAASVAMVGAGLALGTCGPPPGHTQLVSGADLVSGTSGESIVILSGSPSSSRMLEALVSIRAGPLDVVVVAGGRRSADAARTLVDAWQVERVIGDPTIIAVDPDVPFNELPAPPSSIRVGSVELQISDIGGHRRVSAPAVGWRP